MKSPDNKIGEFTYRMIGSILMSFVREFGSDNVRRMIQFIADHEPFWDAAKVGEKMEEEIGFSVQPYKRGAHDFID